MKDTTKSATAKNGAKIKVIKVSKAGVSPIPYPKLLSSDLFDNLIKQ
jgi:hypothetical protein